MPEEPVLSPVSNNVFERRLVVKYIEGNGVDPINGEPLDVDQLLEIKGDLRYYLKVCKLILKCVVLIRAHLEGVMMHITVCAWPCVTPH